jgi:hypothetical protein
LVAAELALPHRVKSRPFQDAAVSLYDLEERMEQVQSEWGDGEPGEQTEQANPEPSSKKKA